MSTSVSKFPTSNSDGTNPWTGTLTNAYAADGAYATVTVPPDGLNYEQTFGTFGFDASIPAGAMIVSTTVEFKWHCSANPPGLQIVRALIYVGGSNIFTVTGTDGQTADETKSGSNSTLNRDNLLDANFSVVMRASNGATTDIVFSLDYVKVTVVYNTPEPTAPMLQFFM